MLARDNRFARALRHALGFSSNDKDVDAAVSFLVSLHDIGKFSCGFQSLCGDDALLDLIGVPLERKRDGTLLRKGYDNRHDALSKLLLEHKVLSKFVDQSTVARLDTYIEAIAGHHGKPVSPPIGGGRVVLRGEVLPPMEADILAFADSVSNAVGGRDNVVAGLRKLAANNDRPAASWLLSGFTSLCDWIGSSEAFFPYSHAQLTLEDYWSEHASVHANYALQTLRIGEVSPAKTAGFPALFPTYSTPTPMQACADTVSLREGAQLFLIEDLTGSGKTEAALTLASRLLAKRGHGSIYFALPTKATANGIFDRLAPIAAAIFDDASPNLVLTHSDARSNDTFAALIANTRGSTHYGTSFNGDEESSVRCSTWLTDSSKKAFFADVGVGTIDQALLGVLPAKYTTLRLLGLCEGVLILDEVHAYDAYTSKITTELIAAMAALGTDVILLSATLTNRQREEFATAFLHGAVRNEQLSATWHDNSPYPLFTQIAPSLYLHSPDLAMVEQRVEALPSNARSLRVDMIHDSEDVITFIRDTAERGSCVAWIRNTVDSAIDAYERLRSELGADRVSIFHSRMTRGDRTVRESEVLARFGKNSSGAIRRGQVLIATQVVEQSLDLDFDEMVTDLAPIDFVLQRAGRLRRHVRDADGNRKVEQSATDERCASSLRVLCPPPHDIATHAWLDTLLPYTSFVYNAPDVLWRTAVNLLHRPTIVLPQEARERLEFVYDDTPAADEALPACLLTPTLVARQHHRSDVNKGELKSFDIEKTPYSRGQSPWIDEDAVQTRLIEPQRSLRLVRVNDDMTVRPWLNDAWDSGDLQIRFANAESLLPTFSAHETRDAWSRAHATACAAMPDRGRYVDLVPVTDGHMGPTFMTRNARGETIAWLYSPTIGLKRSSGDN